MKINSKKQPVVRISASNPPIRTHSLAVCCRETALRLAILTALYPSFTYANPDGAQVVSGQVSIDTATPGVTTVTNSPNAVINWQNFSIAQNEITRFVQQSSQSAVLNRIIGQNPSEILGQLTSNGKVFLINPNGIVFGAGSVIDTQGLVASSLNLSDQDFQNGNYHFMAGSSAGNIINEGIIRAGKDGNIVLIAPQIENNGIIKSDGGAITLAAGQELTITSLDDPDIRFQIQAPADSALNLGKLLAEGGVVNVFANTIKHSGEINADSVEVDAQGNIRLVANQDITLATGSKISANNNQGDAGAIHIESKTGTTLAQGTIEAQATQTGKGGNIELLGEQVGVFDQAKIDASGKNGGGQVLIGGDYQGKNANVHNAKATYIGDDTTIKADAKTNGDGGKVIVWSDNSTRAYGDISAKGGTQSGNGGFIETSGHWLDTTGIRISASALNGIGGRWLLDPWNITIDGTGGTPISGSGGAPDVFTPTTSGSFVQNSIINAALSAGTSVTISTGSTGGELGDITVNAPITRSTDTLTGGTISDVLTLDAAHDIILNSTIQNTNTTTGGKLDVVLNAGNKINLINASASIDVVPTSANAGGVKLVAGTGGIDNANNNTILADTLEVNSAGNVILNGLNKVSTLAASITGGTFGFENGNSTLTIGSVGSTTGVTATGNIAIRQYTAGNIEANQNISSSAGDALLGVASGTGTATVAAGKTVSGGSVQVYTSGGNLTINGAVTGTTSANIHAATGTLNTGSTGLITAPSITLQNDPTTIGGAIGTSATPLKTSSSGGTGNANISIGASSYGPSAVYLSHAGDATLQSINSQNTAPVDITASNNLTATNMTTTNNLNLSAGSLLTVPNSVTLSGANISLTADRMALQGAASSINAGAGTLWLKPKTTNWKIDLGSGTDIASNTLELSTSELNTLAGTGSLRIGALTAGNLNLSGPVAPTGFGSTLALSLESGGTVTQATSADIITASKLAIKAKGNVALDTAPNLVGALAGNINGTGTEYFHFKNSGALTIDTVDGVAGISIANFPSYTAGGTSGVIALETNGNITQTATGSLGGAAVWAYSTGGSVDLTIATNGNATGILAGSAYNNFFYRSSNTIALMNVDGHSGLSSTMAGNIAIGAPGFSNSLATPFTITSGRWLVYAPSPNSVTKNGLTSAFRQYSTAYGGTINTATGNGFIYASAPGTLNVNTTLASGTASNAEGTAPTAVFSYAIGNPTIADNEDFSLITGTPVFTPTLSSATPTGNYNVNYASGLSSSAGYAFTSGNSLTYTVNISVAQQSAIDAANAQAAANAAAAQAAADAAAKAAADAAAADAAAKAAADAAAAQAAADAAAKAAADAAAAQAAADAAAKAAADAAAAQAAADAAAKAAADAAAAQAAADAAAKAAADAAAAQAAADAAAKAAADAANAVPDLVDDKPPTPVEVTLENSLEQVTAVVVATTAQSGSSSGNALGSNSDSPGSSDGTDTTGGSADSTAAKGKSSKQCIK